MILEIPDDQVAEIADKIVSATSDAMIRLMSGKSDERIIEIAWEQALKNGKAVEMLMLAFPRNPSELKKVK